MARSRRSARRAGRRAADRRAMAASVFGRLGGLSVTMLAIMTLVSACAVSVGGTARPAPGLRPRPLAGQSVEAVLLDRTVLSRILKQPMIIDHRFPQRSGGPEALQAGASATSPECLGVVGMLDRTVYRSGRVQGVAVEGWRHASMSAAVTEVREGVVSLPTAADADALFAEFTGQWQHCDGKTQPLSDSVFRINATIGKVHIAGPVLDATVRFALASSAADGQFVPAVRVIGVSRNCLVEVEVDFFGMSSPQGRIAIDNSAQDIAHAMMDRISALN